MALIESIPAFRVPRLLACVARGAALVDPSIRVERGHSFSLDGDALVETDGEVRGRLPGRFTLLPGALTLRVPQTD